MTIPDKFLNGKSLPDLEKLNLTFDMEHRKLIVCGRKTFVIFDITKNNNSEEEVSYKKHSIERGTDLDKIWDIRY